MDQRAFVALAATPQASADARRFVRELIERCAQAEPSYNEVAEPAALLATEFVSASLAHGASSVHLLASCLEDRVRVEVYDTERNSNVSEGEEPETHPIRLRVVEHLASRWSTSYVGSGQLNWFELRLDGTRSR